MEEDILTALSQRPAEELGMAKLAKDTKKPLTEAEKEYNALQKEAMEILPELVFLQRDQHAQGYETEGHDNEICLYCKGKSDALNSTCCLTSNLRFLQKNSTLMVDFLLCVRSLQVMQRTYVARY